MVPEEVVKASIKQDASKAKLAVQDNGLPEGVKILPVTSSPSNQPPPTPPPGPPIHEHSKAPSTPTPPAGPVPGANATAGESTPLIHKRSRLGFTESPVPETTASATTKRRKPGRPKAARLDLPRTIASTAPAPLPPAPQIAATVPASLTAPAAVSSSQTPAAVTASPSPSSPPGPRRISDLSPRKPAPATHHPAAIPNHKPAKTKKPPAHKVGVPHLHYAPVWAFSLRARAKPAYLFLGALGAITLGVASAYGVWLFLTGGGPQVAQSVLHGGRPLVAETILLAIIYYIGRSIGQTAITYGIAREADQRPVTMSRQVGVAINTFGRRLRLDAGFGLAELALLAGAAVLFLAGGQTWPIPPNLQVGLLFATYLMILYLLSSLAISRGLAEVNLTLTTHRPFTAARLGWSLFSHRFELIGPRFGAILMEVMLAIPLIAVALAAVAAAPAAYHTEIAIAAGLLAWLAGALLGAGTAAWWSMLYRQLVVTDRADATVSLLSSRQPEDARRLPLVMIVTASTFAVAASLAIPWLRLG